MIKLHIKLSFKSKAKFDKLAQNLLETQTNSVDHHRICMILIRFEVWFESLLSAISVTQNLLWATKLKWVSFKFLANFSNFALDLKINLICNLIIHDNFSLLEGLKLQEYWSLKIYEGICYVEVQFVLYLEVSYWVITQKTVLISWVFAWKLLSFVWLSGWANVLLLNSW